VTDKNCTVERQLQNMPSIKLELCVVSLVVLAFELVLQLSYSSSTAVVGLMDLAMQSSKPSGVFPPT